MSEITVRFARKRETKNTVVYEETPDEGTPPYVGTLYLQKFAAQRLGSPETLTVTVRSGA